MTCQHCFSEISPAVIGPDGSASLWEDRKGITVCKKLGAGETYLFHKPMPALAGAS